MTRQPIELTPMTRKEVYTALGMSRTDFYRKTKDLQIPKGRRIVPEDLLKICDFLRRNPERLKAYQAQYNPREF